MRVQWRMRKERGVRRKQPLTNLWCPAPYPITTGHAGWGPEGGQCTWYNRRALPNQLSTIQQTSGASTTGHDSTKGVIDQGSTRQREKRALGRKTRWKQWPTQNQQNEMDLRNGSQKWRRRRGESILLWLCCLCLYPHVGRSYPQQARSTIQSFRTYIVGANRNLFWLKNPTNLEFSYVKMKFSEISIDLLVGHWLIKQYIIP